MESVQSTWPHFWDLGKEALQALFYSIWGFWLGITLSLPPLLLAFPRYVHTPGCRHSPPSTRVETQQAKEQHPSSRPQEKLPLHGWKLQWRWLGQAQQVWSGGRRQGGVWKHGCQGTGTRGAWEWDGVASNVPLGIRQTWGRMLVVHQLCWATSTLLGYPECSSVTALPWPGDILCLELGWSQLHGPQVPIMVLTATS